MDARARVPLGRTALRLSRLGVGGGSLFNRSGEDGVRRILDHAWDVGLRYFDTAPFYVGGISEERFGTALSARPRDDYVLSTKVGRYQTPAGDREWFDYSADGTERSIETSLRRLRTDRIDIVYIHDVTTQLHADAYDDRFAEAMGGALPVLERLKSQNVVGAIGVGLSEIASALRFVGTGAFECLMLAGAYTLLRHESLAELLPECVRREVGVVVAAPLNAGILGSGAVAGARFDYRDAPAEVLERVDAIEAICRDYGVPLTAAALHFPLAHPAVAAVVVGHQSPAEVDTNLGLLARPVPASLWTALKAAGLVRPDAP